MPSWKENKVLNLREIGWGFRYFSAMFWLSGNILQGMLGKEIIVTYSSNTFLDWFATVLASEKIYWFAYATDSFLSFSYTDTYFNNFPIIPLFLRGKE